MRICIISKFIPPRSTDGIPRTRWEYACQFAALGHEVHIITSGFKGNERIEQGIYIHEIPVWDQRIFSRMFTSLTTDEITRHLLCYSYLVYERINRLNEVFPIDIIESPLWDIEGYITKLRLSYIPMVVRLETTSMLLREILQETRQYKNSLNELETHFMQLANGLVFDSWSILKETERLYKFNFNEKPYCVIHHGINSAKTPLYLKKGNYNENKRNIKVLIAGRLEKRKGSDILVKQVLPDIFQKNENIEFHIVGKDSAEWDGFKKKEGVSYYDYIKINFKKYLDKKIFLYGYVNDETLDQLYSEADIVLVLSKYESLGLLYLEAMQKEKPVIALETGAVPEIFENGKDAIVISPQSPEKIAQAIIDLKNNPSKRNQLAANAFEKLKNNFSAEQMGRKCTDFFKELVFKKSEERILQVMNCLTDRDGVSNTTIDYDLLLKNKGINTQIIGSWATPEVQHLSQPIEGMEFKKNDYVIYHYWNYCENGEYFNNLTGPHKIFFFHNITTPGFFTKDDESYYATSKGFEQLSMFDNFDIYVCHTEYSANILKQAISKPIITFIIPPVINKNAILEKSYEVSISEQKSHFNILFVGSIAPHKKQADLVRFFYYYLKNINSKARLIIVGGGSTKYVNELKLLVKNLKISDNVHITGKIPDEQLYAYYRITDIFLSMSEHEGFGVPLAEAMAFQIPVVAYRSTAVPDTVGENGCLFEKKDFELISSLLEKLNNEEFREKVIRKQNERLKDFSPDAISNAFEKLKELAHIHRKREVPEKLQIKRPVDDIVMYNDERLIKMGSARITDDHLLLIDCKNGESSVSLEDYFQEVEVTFLSNQWSGKVKISIGNNIEQEFDLYSPQREMKVINLEQAVKPGRYKLIISPTGNKNQHSLSNEIFLEKLILKKPFSLNEEIDGLIDFQIQKNTPAIETESEQLQEILDENPYTIYSDKKILTVVQEISSLDTSINYYNEWITKDLFFRFTNGKTSQNYFEYIGSFSTIEMIFISHEWSGKVAVEVDENYTEILNLYSPKHHEKTFRLNKKFPLEQHHLIVRAIEEKDSQSKGFEVFFKGFILNKKIPLMIDEEKLKKEYRVSIIINTLNRAGHLKSLLQELEKQTYSHFEIVVVNGPSMDKTKEILRPYQDRIKIIDCPEANLSLSRNIGIENASGDYVAFIDDDALPCNENWLENFIYFIIFHSDKKIGTVGGPVKHKNTNHYEFKNGASSDYGFQIFREEELKSHVLDGKRWVQGIPGGNNIVLKKALYEINGFDERFVYYLDETDVCIRLAREGYEIINNPINFIKHFKAPSNLRKNAYDIRWDIIARSDIFYALKNGHDIFLIRLFKTLRFFRKKHFYKEVVVAYKNNVISKEEYKKYRRLLRKGFYAGLKWGLFDKKQKMKLYDKSTTFKNFKQIVTTDLHEYST